MRERKFHTWRPGQTVREHAEDLNRLQKAVEKDSRPAAGLGVTLSHTAGGLHVAFHEDEPEVWVKVLSGTQPYAWREQHSVSSGVEYPTQPFFEDHGNPTVGSASGNYLDLPLYEVNGYPSVPAGHKTRAWLARTNDRLLFEYQRAAAGQWELCVIDDNGFCDSGTVLGHGGVFTVPVEIQVSGGNALTLYQNNTANIAYQWVTTGVHSGKVVNSVTSGKVLQEFYNSDGQKVYVVDLSRTETLVKSYSPENSGANLKSLSTFGVSDTFKNPHGDTALTFEAALNYSLLQATYPDSPTSGPNLWQTSVNNAGAVTTQRSPASGHSGDPLLYGVTTTPQLAQTSLTSPWAGASGPVGFYHTVTPTSGPQFNVYLPSSQTWPWLNVYDQDTGALTFSMTGAGPGSGTITANQLASGVLAGTTSGNFQRWDKVTKLFSDFNVASGAHTVDGYSLPAKTMLHAVVARHTSGFAGGGITAVAANVGISGAVADYVTGLTVSDPPSDVEGIGWQYTPGGIAVGNLPRLFKFESATPLKLQLVATNGTLDELTQGSVDVEFLVSPLV